LFKDYGRQPDWTTAAVGFDRYRAVRIDAYDREAEDWLLRGTSQFL
jgi:hypothetical protein